jgi:hypothetical protein
MIQTVNSLSLSVQQMQQRKRMLHDLAHWFVQVLPPGVLATGNAQALYQDFLRSSRELEAKAGVSDLELLALVLSAQTCIGTDFEQHYPAASLVLHSKALSQSDKALWFAQFLHSFAHLRGVRFALPVQCQGDPPDLLLQAAP